MQRSKAQPPGSTAQSSLSDNFQGSCLASEATQSADSARLLLRSRFASSIAMSRCAAASTGPIQTLHMIRLAFLRGIWRRHPAPVLGFDTPELLAEAVAFKVAVSSA